MNTLTIKLDGHTFEVVTLDPVRPGAVVRVTVNGEPLTAFVPDTAASLDDLNWLLVAGQPCEFVLDRDLHWLKSAYGLHQLEIRDRESSLSRPVSGDGRLKAPIPGQIARVLVTAGQTVEAGAPVVILDAMKMENEIRAPRPGMVKAVHVRPGQNVARDDVLAEIVSAL